MRVLCAGHVNWDVTLRVDGLPDPDGEARIVDEHQSGGGSAANTASVASTLSLSAGILGSVGTDRHGWQARRELVDAGVDVSHLVETGVGTAVKYLVVDPDGRVMVLGDDRGNEAFSPDDVSLATIRGLDHLHLTSQRPSTGAELATMAAEVRVPVSVDPGRLVDRRGFEGALEHAEYVFATEREAEALGIDPDDPADRPGDRAVVVKHGPDGAEVRTPAGRWANPGYRIDPVDTTGAGDAFAGGFLTALVDGWDPRPDAGDGDGGDDGSGDGDDGSGDGDGGDEGGSDDDPDYDRILAAANACGAIAARQTGARVRITRPDVERFLAKRA
ncbi:sugar kinase [Halobacteriales archaeon QS_8_69_26]|nr:MAG: sugar kinase [Halobacteriales archaeon QS_8_69_26]